MRVESRLKMKSKVKQLFITSEAREDIKHILVYTAKEWGREQVPIYRDRFYSGFELLLDNPLLGMSRDDIFTGYRILRIEKHFAIYIVELEQISIIRVLHINRDILNQFLS